MGADFGAQALALWREWFERDGDPAVEGYGSCFFCWGQATEDTDGGHNGPIVHDPRCVWRRARELLARAEAKPPTYTVRVVIGGEEQVLSGVTEVSIMRPDVKQVYDICGMCGLCPDCIATGAKEPCRKRYVSYRSSGGSDVTTVTLTDGTDHVVDRLIAVREGSKWRTL